MEDCFALNLPHLQVKLEKKVYLGKELILSLKKKKKSSNTFFKSLESLK